MFKLGLVGNQPNVFKCRLQKIMELMRKKKDNEAQIFLFIRITQRTEIMHKDDLDSNLLFQYQLESAKGKATHLVEEVVYGNEFICTMSKFFDEQREAENNVENFIWQIAREYVDKLEVEHTNDTSKISAKLKEDEIKIICEIINQPHFSWKTICSMMQLTEQLNKITSNYVYENDAMWRPIQITLRQIPNQLEAQLWIDKQSYIEVIKREWGNEIKGIMSGNTPEVSQIKNLSNLLEPLWSKILDFDNKSFNKKTTPKMILSLMKPITDLLESLPKWLLSGHSMGDSIQDFSDRVHKINVCSNQKGQVIATKSQPGSKPPLPPRPLSRPSSSPQHRNLTNGSIRNKPEVDDVKPNFNKVESPDEGVESKQSKIDESKEKFNELESASITENQEAIRVLVDTKENVPITFETILEERNDYRIKEESKKRIAEILLESENSKLIREGTPNVYLLTVKENFPITTDLRWFEVGRPRNDLRRDHKFIILMGATGSGKSTLIDGMINYILGVKWSDTFRFKCVREDEYNNWNQAHSQTSSVTAYTIHHQDGMAVPYSITFIDTPGYGDTRGVARDKEITATIHRFFLQRGSVVNEIHAACFVAASSDSRLTVTQRYIIDSALSIFGKDFRDNIRLLVTFADNAKPPVVEACRVANFPVTSPSTGITYNKFNSSVLYASNRQQSEDVFGIDELFWETGQQNFNHFFTLLKEIKGKDLISTREVIRYRQQLEQTLMDIESELEECFIKIENMDVFINKMKQLNHKIEANKNFFIEKTEMKLVQIPCEEGQWAYNCAQCQQTCDLPMSQTNSKELPNSKSPCKKNKCSGHDHSYQRFFWCNTPVKVETTMEKVKAEFELNNKRKLKTEELLGKCSEELSSNKIKVIDLLHQVGTTARSLDATALRSNALGPADYLSLMRIRVAEKQAPGYLTRLETLSELQQQCQSQNDRPN